MVLGGCFHFVSSYVILHDTQRLEASVLSLEWTPQMLYRSYIQHLMICSCEHKHVQKKNALFHHSFIIFSNWKHLWKLGKNWITKQKKCHKLIDADLLWWLHLSAGLEKPSDTSWVALCFFAHTHSTHTHNLFNVLILLRDRGSSLSLGYLMSFKKQDSV